MTPLERENRDLRRANERLGHQLEEAQARIADLRRLLGATAADEVQSRLKKAWPKLYAGEIWLLALLYAGRGEIVTKEKIKELTPRRDPDDIVSDRVISVRLSSIRGWIGREAIKNHHGLGWHLTAAGIAKCDAAISGDHA